MKAFTPIAIGNLTLKNRIVMAPMVSNLGSPEGWVTDQHIRYMAERAKGGTALLITEYTYVDKLNSRGSPNELGAYSYELAPKLSRLTEKVKENGARIFMQLVHSGGKAYDAINPQSNIAPSSINYRGTTPREMSAEDINRVKNSFLEAAMLAERCGFDGVEIHGAHGYLIHEFISPALNLRTDAYGGSLENRVRFANEIVANIRRETDLAVGMRLSLMEFEQDGYGPDYGFSAAQQVRKVDYVHFSAGRNAPPGSSGSFYIPHIPIVAKIPGRLGVPIMAVGSIANENDIETALQKVDLVSIARGLLADPYLPLKMQKGSGMPRPCIRCNQACRRLGFGEVRCTVNPDTGYEGLYPRIPPVYHGDLAVIGGGIKGMEASLFAAKLGFSVAMYEKEEVLGGQLNAISEPAQRSEFSQLIRYYEDSLRKAKVVITLSQEHKGKGLLCLPDLVYPKLPDRDSISVDTNVYQYLDSILPLSATRKITLSERSLRSLDSGRAFEYRKAAEMREIRIVDQEEYDFILFDRNQYDIRSAMVSGRNAVLSFISENGNEYL